jgi:8-oxo-dGTP diphosphatase
MITIPNAFYRISIKALIFDTEGRIMLSQEENKKWDFPGGGLNFGENPRESLLREICEEMGIKITYIKDTPSYFITSKEKDEKFWRCGVFYEAKLENYNFIPSDECIAIKFFSREDALIEDLYPLARKFFLINNK